MILISIALVLVGFILLVKSSDLFIDNAALTAKTLGVSNFIIGLTLVAVGTSLPELATTVIAVLNNEENIALGNILGSNIANIGLIAGLTTLVGVVKTKEIMFQRDALILAFISLIFYFFTANFIISESEGIVLLILFLFYVIYLSEEKVRLEKKQNFSDFIEFIVRLRMIKLLTFHSKNIFLKDHATKKKELGIRLVIAMITLSGVILGGYLFIKGAASLAIEMNLSTTFIGLTLVAVGTSLPELSVSLTAARKGFSDMFVGNIIGSNITNLTLILGTGVLLKKIEVSLFTFNFTVLFMFLITIVFVFFLGSRKELRRFEGLIMLGLYIFFLYYIHVNAALM